MKKLYFIAAVAGAVLAGCANNDTFDSNFAESLGDKVPVRFAAGVDNLFKSAISAQDAKHYEFGVFAFRGETESPENMLMKNYLVGWGGNSLYKDLKELANPSTWGDAEEELDGQSLWYYEGLSPQVKTPYKAAEFDQVIKYWDKSTATTSFYAYAPFTISNAAPAEPGIDDMKQNPNNPKYAAYESDNITMTGLASFYVSPLYKSGSKTEYYQIAGTDERCALVTPANYNDEMLNYNEAVYAKSIVPNANYGKDVKLTFKHVNAKINLAFYESIRGYKVQILDMVPEGGIHASESTNPDIAKLDIPSVEAQSGIVLTPATHDQVIAIPQAKDVDLPYYLEDAAEASIKFAAQTDDADISVNGAPVNPNLYFNCTDGLLGEEKSDMVRTNTWLYVIPNYQNGEYIATAAEGSQHALDLQNTGYTLHISYRIIPNDGLGTTDVYDARVWIPADACRWEAGKSYTYVFNITSNSNGSTNPWKLDPDPDKQGEGDQEFWADPRDPRVDNTEPALQPIVFDGVMVQEYDEVELTEQPA